MATMSLNGEVIRKMLVAAEAVGGQDYSYDDIAKLFSDAMLNYGDGQFDTVDKVAALMSECMMESDYFRTTEEYVKTNVYAPYIGRSWIQVTWQDNYLAFGEWCQDRGLVEDPRYFVKNPNRLADKKWAALGGVWYFTAKRFFGKPLTAYASNIGQVGKAVNLGSPYSLKRPNGWKAREDAYKAVKSVGASIVPKRDISEGVDFMVKAKPVYFRNTLDNPLKPGNVENKIFYNEKKPTNVTIVSGESDGVDIQANVTVVDAAGNRITDGWRSFWRIDSVATGRADVRHHARDAVPAPGLNSFKGTIKGKPKVPGELRLRLIVQTEREGLRVSTVEITGFVIE